MEKDGVHVRYYKSGAVKMRYSVRDGRRHGRAEGWYESGKKKWECTWSNGVLHGKAVGWYENGQKDGELTWSNGVMVGWHRAWYENGQKSGEIFYDNDGKAQGKATDWYPDGTRKSETTYVDGVTHGLCETWYPNGQLRSRGLVKINKMQHMEKWEDEGNKICECVFKDGKPWEGTMVEIVDRKFVISTYKKGNRVEFEEKKVAKEYWDGLVYPYHQTESDREKYHESNARPEDSEGR